MRFGILQPFLKHLGATFPTANTEPVSESLESVATKALVLIYMADIGKFGNPPSEHYWWSRETVRLDGRLAQVIMENGLVDGRSKVGGIPAEVRLTKKGVFVALSDIGKVKD